MSNLANRLKEARKNKRYTQKEVSEKLGISIGTLSGYERSYREPDIKTIKRLAELYDVSSAWLMDEEEEDTSSIERFFDDPDLETWYRELPESDEEELRQMKEIWEIIKKKEN